MDLANKSVEQCKEKIFAWLYFKDCLSTKENLLQNMSSTMVFVADAVTPWKIDITSSLAVVSAGSYGVALVCPL